MQEHLTPDEIDEIEAERDALYEGLDAWEASLEAKEKAADLAFEARSAYGRGKLCPSCGAVATRWRGSICQDCYIDERISDPFDWD